MRISRTFVFIGAVILVIAGVGVFQSSRHKTRYVSIEYQRPYPPETIEQWDKQKARIYSIVPLDSTFSNAVAVLGSDFTAVTNGDVYWADFRSALPGDTNVSDVVLRVQDDKIEWLPFAPPSLKFPPHKSDETKH